MAVLSEHSVSYAGGSKQITYYATGPTYGPLLIFIHGWPAIGKTWHYQLETFSSLGFRCVAPDMPAYGKSTANKVKEDYSQQSIVEGMVALLEDTGRSTAVWIGHDWGAGCVWSFVKHHPDKCTAVINLSVPYHTLELGLEATVATVNRDIYPADKYPWGQWGYQAFYEQSFDKATAWFDSNPEGFIKLCYSKGPHAALGEPAFTATVVDDGGWFGGPTKMPTPPPAEAFPSEGLMLPESVVNELAQAMKKTSFYGADAYYANHAANNKFNTDPTRVKNDAVLYMPALYIQGKYDTVCDTAISRLAEPQRQKCRNLTEANVDSGHWIQMEKPTETNAIIARFLVEECPEYWPSYWANPVAKKK